jgi:formate-nitrite transporter family protein
VSPRDPTGQDHREGGNKADDRKRPELDPDEEQKAKEEESLNANITYEVINREGKKELERSSSALAWSALAGGLAMGFSFAAEGLLRSHLPDAEWRPLITKLGYPVGFLIVTLGSQQLFTENTLTPIVPLLVKKTREMFTNVARLWTVILIANLIGALLFATALAHTGIFEPEVKRAFTDIGQEALKGDFVTTLLRGVFAGWLIALMVWMLPAASTAQPAVIAAMTYLVGIGGFAHIIVGSSEVLYLVVRGEATVVDYLMRFMIPALLGNVIGGLTLVAGVNHAQVASGKQSGNTGGP